MKTRRRKTEGKPRTRTRARTRKRDVPHDQLDLGFEEPGPPPKGVAELKHTCHMPRCTVEVPPEMLMCRRHWGMVPKVIQIRVYRHFDSRQCVKGTGVRPSKAWFDAAEDAIRAALRAEKERGRT